MIVIRFADAEAKKRALGYLMGRLSFRSWASGEVVVPATALADLATQGISFQVVGPPTYQQLAIPLAAN